MKESVMRRVVVIFVLLIFVVIGCGKKADVGKLEPGTPIYDFAKEITAKLPVFDPDKNNVIVKTKKFDVTSGELLLTLKRSFGNRIDGLAGRPADQLTQILKQQAEQYATTELLFNAAKKANFEATQANVDSVLNIRFERSGGEEKFAEQLAENGLTVDDVKQDIFKYLSVNKYLDNALAEEVKVTDEDIQNEYNQDKTATVQHILMLTQGKSDSAKMEIKKKMEDVLAKAKKGEDFGELAKKYSEDPGSKEKGGLYEDFTRGRMVKPFEDASFDLPIGAISDLVETRYGYHIVKVIDRKKETRSLEEVHDQIKSKLDNVKKRDAYQNFVEKLKTDNNFEIVGL